MSWPFSGKLSAKCLAIFCSSRNVGLKDSVQSLQENIFQHSVALCSKIDQHGARFPPVSHMGHYASLAQKSMDSFVLVTAPLHFTSGGACAPPKHSATCWNEDFETSTSQPRPIAAGTVSWQNKFPTDTVNVFPVK